MRIKLLVSVIAAVMLIVGANTAIADGEGYGRIEISNQASKPVDIFICVIHGDTVYKKIDPTNDYTYEKTGKNKQLYEFSVQSTTEQNPKCIKRFVMDEQPSEFNYRVKVMDAPIGQEKLGITCEITGNPAGSPQGVF